MAKTLVAIPAYNEEVALGSVVLKAREYVDEVLVVDDGSQDDTSRVASMALATLLSHRENLGKGAAIRTAFDYARRNGHEVLLLMDGDGQHDSDDIPTVMEPVLDGGADVALGKRWGKADGMPLLRRAGKRALDYTTAAFTGSVTDSQCGFRAFSRRAIETLDLHSAGFGAESEILIQAEEAGLKVAEVPINSRYDVEGSTLKPVVHGYRVVDSILRVIAERHPLFFFGIPGLVAFLLGIYLGVYTLQIYNETGAFALGYA
ncbi:MAG: glycosyltransferase family 2 protein, partial [Candidatus Methylomirabilales bacterium]